MTVETEITGHYTSGDLMDRLRAALAEDGVDPDRPTIAELAPHDQFHGRGLEATEELAKSLSVAASDHLLDVGSGIGGPARYFADRFGCRVTGIDLTAEFCAVARQVTQMMGLDDRVAIHEGNALATPFEAASFDGAYSMNVSMNIADKDGFYREIHRVLKPGGWLVLSEIAQGPGGAVQYPTPWATKAGASFLATPAATRDRLEAVGFVVEQAHDKREASLAFGVRAREIVERGGKAPHRSVTLIHGAERASVMAANVARGTAEAALIPIEIHCRKGG